MISFLLRHTILFCAVVIFTVGFLINCGKNVILILCGFVFKLSKFLAVVPGSLDYIVMKNIL